VTTLLEIDTLQKTFHVGRSLFSGRGRKIIHAVRGASFRIGVGEVFGLVGESGSGKSTVARCVVGLEQPTAGRVRFRDQNIEGLSYREFRPLRRDIQMVFQDPASSLNPRMTAARAIEEPLRLLTDLDGETRRAAVRRIMAEVGLSAELAGRHRHQLSGGQQQRVSIARALVVNPKLLVLDEPVSALDASIQAQVLALLRELQVKHELSYLFISHDLDTVQALCHRVGIMRYGRIVEMGTVEQIFTNQLHPYTRLLLASMLAADPSDPRRNHLEREQALFAEPGLPAQEEQAADDEPMGELEAPSLVDTGQGHLVESSALTNTSDL